MNEAKETERFIVYNGQKPMAEPYKTIWLYGLAAYLERAKLDRTEEMKAICGATLGLMNIGKSEHAKVVLQKALAE